MAQAIQGDKHIPFYQLEEFLLLHFHCRTYGTVSEEAIEDGQREETITH